MIAYLPSIYHKEIYSLLFIEVYFLIPTTKRWKRRGRAEQEERVYNTLKDRVGRDW